MTNQTPLKTAIRGRCTRIEKSAGIPLAGEVSSWDVILTGMQGDRSVQVKGAGTVPPCRIGDIVAFHPSVPETAVPETATPGYAGGASTASGTLEVLTATHTPGSLSWMKRTLDPRRRHALAVRAETEAGIREFFSTAGFLETPTPTLVPCPGMEIHIRPFQTTSGAYLPTSPEFAMKRLLVGGLEKIFQLTKSFRSEPNSKTHHPEFTMLEWYRAYAGFREIMLDTENLVEFLARKILGRPEIDFAGQKISVKAPWKRVTVAELFREHVDLELNENTPREVLSAKAKSRGHTHPEDATWDDLFFLLFLNEIEPRLPKDEAVIVSHYPPSQAALSVVEVNEKGERWARRFEFYIAGLELGNAFEELTDATEQRKRFVADMHEREKIYGPEFPKNPLDEDFLSALEEGMPPAGGIAVGVDRLVMLLSGETEIDRTLWLPSFVSDSRSEG